MNAPTRLLLPLLLAGSPALADGPVRIALRDATRVAGTPTLGDVARVEGADADRLAGLRLPVGDDGTISGDDVVAALRDAGLGRHEMLLRGPDAVAVRRVAAPAAPAPATDEWSQLARPTPAATPADEPEAEAVGFVAQLVRPVARGQVIRKDDVKRVSRGERGDGFANHADVIGTRARRDLRLNTVVLARDLAMPLLVRRGQQARVEILTGGVVVHAAANALEDANFGKVARFRLTETRQEIRATVTGPGLARVTR